MCIVGPDMRALRVLTLCSVLLGITACAGDVVSTETQSQELVCTLGSQDPVAECVCAPPGITTEGVTVEACPAALGCCLRGSVTCGCFDLAYVNGRLEPEPGDPPLLSCQQILDADPAVKEQGFRVVDSCTISVVSEQ
jgi:hypothetical protein